MRLSDRIAIVTGAGSGLGKATAVLLAEEGAAVGVLDRDAAAAEATASEIGQVGGKASAVGVDVTEEREVEDAVRAVEDRFGAPGILVNAAGIVVRKSLLETSSEEWRRVVDTNLTGYFHLLKHVVPVMAGAGGGAIVQIASIAGHIGYGYSSYTAAKGGVLAITRQLAAELAQQSIRINSISPGVVESGLNRDTLGTPVIRAATIGNTPWGRLGQPVDIARAALFLLGDDSDFVTGADLVVDGGMTSTIQWGAASESMSNFHAKASSQEERRQS